MRLVTFRLKITFTKENFFPKAIVIVVKTDSTTMKSLSHFTFGERIGLVAAMAIHFSVEVVKLIVSETTAIVGCIKAAVAVHNTIIAKATTSSAVNNFAIAEPCITTIVNKLFDCDSSTVERSLVNAIANMLATMDNSTANIRVN